MMIILEVERAAEKVEPPVQFTTSNSPADSTRTALDLSFTQATAKVQEFCFSAPWPHLNSGEGVEGWKRPGLGPWKILEECYVGVVTHPKKKYIIFVQD